MGPVIESLLKPTKKFVAKKSKFKCPNCLNGNMETFYRVDDIPAHSCLLMETRQDAVNYPVANLELGLCPTCGFIANTLYDPAFKNYNFQYEETQGFSERFNGFLVALVKQLIEGYDIHNKTILEIGCGKGEFLCLMCDLGNNNGIGIDPACIPKRIPKEYSDRVRIISDYYSSKYSNLEADVVCCRHTLEHISETKEFLTTVREAIGNRKDVLVLFELPDTLRVLQEGAFWDIYYEHCSYFTPGSLARLFRQCGFEIDKLYLEYGNQYILLTAHPSDNSNSSKLNLEDDLGQLKQLIQSFPSKVSKTMGYWRKFIQSAHKENKRGVIWGSGSKGVAFLSTLKLDREIEYVVDINPYRQGKFMPGTAQQIIAPDELIAYKPDYVIVMNPIYKAEIKRNLEKMRLEPELLSI